MGEINSLGKEKAMQNGFLRIIMVSLTLLVTPAAWAAPSPQKGELFIEHFQTDQAFESLKARMIQNGHATERGPIVDYLVAAAVAKLPNTFMVSMNEQQQLAFAQESKAVWLRINNLASSQDQLLWSNFKSLGKTRGYYQFTCADILSIYRQINVAYDTRTVCAEASASLTTQVRGSPGIREFVSPSGRTDTLPEYGVVERVTKLEERMDAGENRLTAVEGALGTTTAVANRAEALAKANSGRLDSVVADLKVLCGDSCSSLAMPADPEIIAQPADVSAEAGNANTGLIAQMLSKQGTHTIDIEAVKQSSERNRNDIENLPDVSGKLETLGNQIQEQVVRVNWLYILGVGALVLFALAAGMFILSKIAKFFGWLFRSRKGKTPSPAPTVDSSTPKPEMAAAA